MLLEGDPIAGALLSHVNRCDRCREFYLRSKQIDDHFSSTLEHPPAPMPAALRDRVNRAVRNAASESKGQSAELHWAIPAFAAASVLAVTAFWLLREPGQGPGTADNTASQAPVTEPVTEEEIAVEYAKLEQDLLAVSQFLGSSFEGTLSF